MKPIHITPITWAEILWSRRCSSAACETPIKPNHGLSRAFCEAHTSEIPARIALHLDRSTRGSWFLAWWRLAKRELRTLAIKQAQEYNKPRNQRQAAVESTERAG
jgi:hypothetical protein